MVETLRLLNLVQQEKDRLTALISSINAEVWFVDVQKKLTLANSSALREFRLNPEEEIDVEKFSENQNVVVNFSILKKVSYVRDI